MATVEMHFMQYKQNKETLHILRSIEKPPHDWVVTVAFYSALHLVESELSKKGNASDDHKERNKKVFVDNELGLNVANAYRSLWNKSRDARYKCYPVSSRAANEAVDVYLKMIEDELNS